MSIDVRISRFIFDVTRHSKPFTSLAKIGAGPLVWALGGGAACLWMFAFRPDPTILGSVCARLLFIILAGVLLWAVCTALQFLFRRKRPFQTFGHPESLAPLGWVTPSFPSGHATLAFAAASVLAFTTGMPFPFFVIASIVALSRVAVGVHYLGDVIAGALLGMLGFHVAILFLSLFSSLF